MSDAELGTLKVLVVDDQRSMRAILRQLLRDIGVDDVVEAEDGGAALKILFDNRRNLPDLIICDLYMDGMDGGEFCNTVRRDRDMPGHGVPILILTGEQDDLVHEVARQMGAVGVMVKPVSPQQLRKHVRKAVGFEV